MHVFFKFIILFSDNDFVWFKELVTRDRAKSSSFKTVGFGSRIMWPDVHTPELALCSLKGKKTNAHKNAFQKQAIDEEKVKGIIGMSFFILYLFLW